MFELLKLNNFIVISHLLEYPDAQILSFDEGEVKEMKYEDQSIIKFQSIFLQHREKMIMELFKED